jgi:2-polyprenyl-3-methyl-5-hydroxy-6-metoxy-1,4-benzoquinol methylase
VLTEIGNLNGCSVLDVGCGFGDLCGFLIKRGIKVKYTGYDINPKFIRIAKETYPNVRFEVRDIEECEIKNKFDWVFASGVFEFKLLAPYVKKMIRKMFEACKRGVAVDFMSSYVDFKTEDNYFASPEKMFSFCKTLSRRVVLRHDYMPFEFCVYVYKNDRIDERNVFVGFEGSK